MAIDNRSIGHGRLPFKGSVYGATKWAVTGYGYNLREELVAANVRINALLSVTPRTFAYPCGQTFVGRGAGHTSYVPIVAKHFLVGRWGFNEISNDPGFMDLALATSLPVVVAFRVLQAAGGCAALVVP